MAMPSKWVYKFGGGTAEGRITQKTILGGKVRGQRVCANYPADSTGITLVQHTVCWWSRQRAVLRCGLPALCN